jgi:hypothetical protein
VISGAVPGFEPRACEVMSSFQAFAFKRNLYRQVEANHLLRTGDLFATHTLTDEDKVGGLYKLRIQLTHSG